MDAYPISTLANTEERYRGMHRAALETESLTGNLILGARRFLFNSEDPAMLTREEVRKLALEAKDKLGLSWPKLGEAIGRDPVYASLLVYGYGQANSEEAEGLVRTLALPKEAVEALKKGNRSRQTGAAARV